VLLVSIDCRLAKKECFSFQFSGVRNDGCGILDDERREVEGRRLMVADNLKISELSYPFSDFCHLPSGRPTPETLILRKED
jgi:hypothetical protein